MGTKELVSASSLCRLADYYGTDKAGFYTPFYDLLFRDRREKIYKVLEIGIGTPKAMTHVPMYVPGASLRMWRDYFPNAEIFGIDKDVTAVNQAASERIMTFECDQSDEGSLEEILPHLALGGKFDLILDDGSHKPEDQLLTFRILSRLLDSRGLYIIEDTDTQSSRWRGHDLPDCAIVANYQGHLAGHCILIRGEALNG